MILNGSSSKKNRFASAPLIFYVLIPISKQAWIRSSGIENPVVDRFFFETWKGLPLLLRNSRRPQRGCFTKKSSPLSRPVFFIPSSHLQASLRWFSGIKKKPVIQLAFLCSGDRTRTCDLWVMSPTSYQLLHPAIS